MAETPGAPGCFQVASAHLGWRARRGPASLPVSGRGLAARSTADDTTAIPQEIGDGGTPRAEQGSEMGSHPCPSPH